MCWNKEVSLTTFVMAMIGVAYLYYRNGPNDRWVAVFAAIVAMIQLAEFFMWSDLQCGVINKYASIFAIIVLALEPLTNMIGGIYFSNSPHKNILRYMLIAYIIFVGYTYFRYIHNNNVDWCGTTVCSGQENGNVFFGKKMCNLQWYFMESIGGKTGIIWILFLMLPFLTMTPRFQGMLLFTLGFVSFAIASVANGAATGSLWCWFAIAVIYLKILVL
ncbi:mg257 protein [Tupanvirus deep ocean]|uniref:Mg257 protein n=2 Tax=Tupanvirus TaxID=2094720 RepID=A0AC62A9T5_9VIRU|nr:mg257 protein [Tupanvirus deep ocean]QKU34551.1 mg257 protein [Tupanvirus deep ocean]